MICPLHVCIYVADEGISECRGSFAFRLAFISLSTEQGKEERICCAEITLMLTMISICCQNPSTSEGYVEGSCYNLVQRGDLAKRIQILAVPQRAM